jgi:hypothetical protein
LSTTSIFYTNLILSPIQQINDRKGDLHKVESVYIIKRCMTFSLPSFELRYIHYLANSLRPKLIAPAIALIAYSLYSLFASNWFTSEQYITKWSTAPNVLYNVTWISLVMIGLLALYVGSVKGIFVCTLEVFFQYWALYIVTVGILFGNRWRVTRICGIEYDKVFDANTDRYPEIDLVMLLVGIIIYMAVYAELRLRRLIWVAVFTFLIYAGTAIGFGIPVPRINVPINEVPYIVDRNQAIFLSISLFLLFAVALLGKFTLELLQRRNFLELELAEKRIDVLEKTINAMDDDNQPHTQLEQSHRRLKDAERIIEKVRLIGITAARGDVEANPQLAFAQELETALALIRKTERNMTMLDLHKEVLLGPIKTGVEWKQEEVINWIETVVNPVRAGNRSVRNSGGTAGAKTPSEVSFHTSTGGGHVRMSRGTYKSPSRRTSTTARLTLHSISDEDLGISAKSLMKSIGLDWNLSLLDLEHTLHSNKATDLSAVSLVARVLIGQYSREYLNCSLEVVAGFAKVIDEGYLDVPFHNSYHAAQVCHHVNVLAEMVGVRRVLSRIDQAALTVASLCHDFSHFGRSNAFLVETQHELAIRYNDTSVLENFHAAKTFQAIKSSAATDITAGLSRREERRFRARVIQLILATDSANHFQLVAELRMRLMGKSLFEDPQMEETDKRVVLSVLIRAADLGYHAMPLDVHTMWAERLAEEYAQQGDDERALGLTISPMCDRRSQDIPSMQIGFMNLVVMPLFDEVFNLVRLQNHISLDSFGDVCGQLVSNHAHWTQVRGIGAGADPATGEVGDQADRMSDGSELYIPAPDSEFPRRIDYEFSNHGDASSPNSAHTDLIQRVYSTEIARSNSGSIRPPRGISQGGLSGMSGNDGSAISLTYSQAHGYFSRSGEIDNGDDYSPR